VAVDTIVGLGLGSGNVGVGSEGVGVRHVEIPAIVVHGGRLTQTNWPRRPTVHWFSGRGEWDAAGTSLVPGENPTSMNRRLKLRAAVATRKCR
jgi:hypothetical protein